VFKLVRGSSLVQTLPCLRRILRPRGKADPRIALLQPLAFLACTAIARSFVNLLHRRCRGSTAAQQFIQSSDAHRGIGNLGGNRLVLMVYDDFLWLWCPPRRHYLAIDDISVELDHLLVVQVLIELPVLVERQINALVPGWDWGRLKALAFYVGQVGRLLGFLNGRLAFLGTDEVDLVF
jgi:hypothetical protein